MKFREAVPRCTNHGADCARRSVVHIHMPFILPSARLFQSEEYAVVSTLFFSMLVP